MIFIRSLFFNIFFYGLTALMCVAFIPALLLSREHILKLTRFYEGCVYFLEKYIAGLDFEVRGKEYLPQGQSYIVAAKHQSAYETLKLHHLFGDPTIVLKRELLSLPLFGKFLKKLDVIPINRKNKEEAINSILEGAKRMKDQKRPIVIFPQGTRVGVQVPSKNSLVQDHPTVHCSQLLTLTPTA